MLKTLIKRSYFTKVVTTSGSVPTPVMVEADEVYITLASSSTSTGQVRRQRERDLANFLVANPTVGGPLQTWGTLETTSGRVNLDNPLTSDGKLQSRPVTTAANDLTQPERHANQGVGMKELIELKSTTDGSNAIYIIEQVHYQPAPEVGV